MTRTLVDDKKLFPKDKRWVMRCDVSGCTTKSEPSVQFPPLEQFVAAGWFIGATFCDICPECVAKGVMPWDVANRLMNEVAL